MRIKTLPWSLTIFEVRVAAAAILFFRSHAASTSKNKKITKIHDQVTRTCFIIIVKSSFVNRAAHVTNAIRQRAFVITFLHLINRLTMIQALDAMHVRSRKRGSSSTIDPPSTLQEYNTQKKNF
jgi:hypothetical protein